MAIVGFKKNRLNSAAYANGHKLIDITKELREEYTKQMPKCKAGTRLAAILPSYESPPPDVISLPREKFERLMTQLGEMSASLLKYSEPPLKR
jgi:hypothetical protein